MYVSLKKMTEKVRRTAAATDGLHDKAANKWTQGGPERGDLGSLEIYAAYRRTCARRLLETAREV